MSADMYVDHHGELVLIHSKAQHTVQVSDDITFDPCGRMTYHPEFHTNHGVRMTEEELEYLCKFWETDHRRSMSYALGRTEGTLCSKVNSLRRSGQFDYYKNLNKHW